MLKMWEVYLRKSYEGHLMGEGVQYKVAPK